MAIRTDIQGHIGELVLDHPPVNALDSQRVERAAPTSSPRSGANAEVRCVLVRAEGKGFCAGVDIKEMQQHPRAHRRAQPRQLPHLSRRARAARCRW